jgi:hypothetical protein
MRTIGFRSNVLFVLAACVGLLAALDRPWYSQAPPGVGEETGVGEIHSGVEAFFSRLAREFTTSTGTSGWEAFTSTDTILVALIAVAVISSLGVLIPAVEQPARELLRLVALAMLGIVVVKLANTPDHIGLVERRQGVWIALGVTGIMASSATTIYNAPLTRRKRARSLYDTAAAAPPRSTVFDAPGSSAAAPADPS